MLSAGGASIGGMQRLILPFASAGEWAAWLDEHHADTPDGLWLKLAKKESGSKPDRGVVTVETRGYKQDGTLVCVFRRRVMVPTRAHAGPELPSFPTPKPA